MQAITPSVGRKVWYFESMAQIEPYDGTIVKVWFDDEGRASPDSLCNIFVVEPGGHTRTVTSIRCAQEGLNVPHFQWMPYQMEQVAKAMAEGNALPPPPAAPAGFK